MKKRMIQMGLVQLGLLMAGFGFSQAFAGDLVSVSSLDINAGGTQVTYNAYNSQANYPGMISNMGMGYFPYITAMHSFYKHTQIDKCTGQQTHDLAQALKDVKVRSDLKRLGIHSIQVSLYNSSDVISDQYLKSGSWGSSISAGVAGGVLYIGSVSESDGKCFNASVSKIAQALDAGFQYQQAQRAPSSAVLQKKDLERALSLLGQPSRPVSSLAISDSTEKPYSGPETSDFMPKSINIADIPQ